MATRSCEVCGKSVRWDIPLGDAAVWFDRIKAVFEEAPLCCDRISFVAHRADRARLGLIQSGCGVPFLAAEVFAGQPTLLGRPIHFRDDARLAGTLVAIHGKVSEVYDPEGD